MPVSALIKMSMFNTTTDFLLRKEAKKKHLTKKKLSGKKKLYNVSKWHSKRKGNY